MIQSMTGYGKSELNLAKANFIIEVKSLNSKQLDANVKISSAYRDKEIGLRKLLSENLFRGKVELSVWKEKNESTLQNTLNTQAIKEYYSQIFELRKALSATNNMFTMKSFDADLLPTVLKMPNVYITKEDNIVEEDWTQIKSSILKAIAELIKYRTTEGLKLEKDINLRIKKISSLLLDIKPFADSRIKKIKQNLFEKISSIESKKVDENRLEQELIFYLEKQDITEEQVRLKAHLEYFTDTVKTDFPNGKKLGFIAQEIGREINTIGSKSSDADMQRLIVQMKDELEKIKEQLLNIL
ncbi:MAG: YicC/YloC family endoribonuclease [Flavobacteriales bacterium]|jgi:uncharacterized protein (TIGR00255 family)|tara:strand:+ start:45888 stop:46784 length:897 start_codon:yes stop_codon:yes gene_type:complete